MEVIRTKDNDINVMFNTSISKKQTVTMKLEFELEQEGEKDVNDTQQYLATLSCTQPLIDHFPQLPTIPHHL
ncbi:MAG TPA: hypothetical protein ENI23_13930 [bacterium]|nr:hypothetical protein [bacterium]